jgi:hypothetical protein
MSTADMAEGIIRSDMRRGRRASGDDAHSRLVRSAVRYLRTFAPEAWQRVLDDYSCRG